MTLAIIQCRLGSTRFPRKALEKLNDGRPVIAHVVERARKIVAVDRVVVATVPRDVAEIADACDVAVWCAQDIDENDVLGRFARLAAQLSASDVLRLTADCPLLDPLACERLVDVYRNTSLCSEYAWIDTASGAWPDGLDAEIFSRRLLERANKKATDPADREHCTPWMRRNTFVVGLPPDPAYAGWPKLSIDTPEDLERVKQWQLTAK